MTQKASISIAASASVILLGAAGWYGHVSTKKPKPHVALPVIITETIPDAICGQPYHAVIQATGTKPFAWQIVSNDPALAWLELTTVNDEAVLSGTPPVAADGGCPAEQQIVQLRASLGMK